MILIKKWWSRLIFSLIVAGVISESVSVLTDNAININSFLVGIGLYLALSLVYGFIQMGEKKEYSKKNDTESNYKAKAHDGFILKQDLNLALPEGSKGTILMAFPNNEFLVEFGKKDGSNVEFEGQSSFTISDDMIEITWIDPVNN